MDTPRKLKVAIVAHAAVDLFLEESSLPRFKRYNPSMTIEELLETNRSVRDGETRGSLYQRLGGPVLTIGHHLAAKHRIHGSPFEVSAVTILGDDEPSRKYEETLKNLEMRMTQVHRYKGTLSRCAYVYPKGKPIRQLPPIWEDGVSEHFSKIEVPKHFLEEQDMVVLPITPPPLAQRVAETYEQMNRKGVLVYNPGFYLLDPSFSFGDTGFERIMRRTNVLVMNRDEREAVRKNGVKKILDLFHEYPSLMVLISTKDVDGSVIHIRDDKSSEEAVRLYYSSLKGNSAATIETPVGAGDAFLGAFLRYSFGIGYELDDAHREAEKKAIKQLGIKGAVDPYVISSGVLQREESEGSVRLAK